MPKGKRHRFTEKQDRQAKHIAAGYGGGKEALSIGYATVNKQKGRISKLKKKFGSKRYSRINA